MHGILRWIRTVSVLTRMWPINFFFRCRDTLCIWWIFSHCYIQHGTVCHNRNTFRHKYSFIHSFIDLVCCVAVVAGPIYHLPPTERNVFRIQTHTNSKGAHNEMPFFLPRPLWCFEAENCFASIIIYLFNLMNEYAIHDLWSHSYISTRLQPQMYYVSGRWLPYALRSRYFFTQTTIFS